MKIAFGVSFRYSHWQKLAKGIWIMLWEMLKSLQCFRFAIAATTTSYYMYIFECLSLSVTCRVWSRHNHGDGWNGHTGTDTSGLRLRWHELGRLRPADARAGASWQRVPLDHERPVVARHVAHLRVRHARTKAEIYSTTWYVNIWVLCVFIILMYNVLAQVGRTVIGITYEYIVERSLIPKTFWSASIKQRFHYSQRWIGGRFWSHWAEPWQWPGWHGDSRQVQRSVQDLHLERLKILVSHQLFDLVAFL